MFGKKKKVTKSEDLMKKAPAPGAVELGDDVLEAAAGGYTIETMSLRDARELQIPGSGGAIFTRNVSVLRGVAPDGREIVVCSQSRLDLELAARSLGIK